MNALLRELFIVAFAFDIGRGDLLGATHRTGCATQNVLNHAVVKHDGDIGCMSLFCAKQDSKTCGERCGSGKAVMLMNLEGTDFGHL